LELSVGTLQFPQNRYRILLAGQEIESHIKMADEKAQADHQYHKQ
jgi:hypothetical protein